MLVKAVNSVRKKIKKKVGWRSILIRSRVRGTHYSKVETQRVNGSGYFAGCVESSIDSAVRRPDIFWD
jgi:hypothetical protein